MRCQCGQDHLLDAAVDVAAFRPESSGARRGFFDIIALHSECALRVERLGPTREGYRRVFRFEAFNFPNHPNWGNPERNLTSPSFGQIRTTRTNMREMQVALKYMF